MISELSKWAFLGEILAGLGVYLLVAVLLARLRYRRWYRPKKLP